MLDAFDQEFNNNLKETKINTNKANCVRRDCIIQPDTNICQLGC